MLSTKRGGLEQSAVDWHYALQSRGHFVLSVGQKNSWFATQFLDQYYLPFAHPLTFDVTAPSRLQQKLAFCDLAICHGNRAISFAARMKPSFTRVGVAHNFRTKAALGQLDAAVAVSPAVQAHLAEAYPRLRSVEVPNLVRPPDRPFDNAMGSRVRMGVIGRLHANKGFDTAIEAYGLLQSMGVEAELVIAGSGEERADLERRVAALGSQARVRFLGWVEDKRSFFREIDVFLLPSRTEPFGIVVLEAMAFGIPVIAAAIDGPKDIITDGRDGLLVATSSAAGFAEATARVARSEALRSSLRRHALETIATRYGFDAVSKRMSDFVSGLATTR